MKKLISKSFTFEAAHSLDVSNNNKNKNIHGHSFHVSIFIKDEIDEKNGMILDFHLLDEEVKKLKETLDHCYLNNIDDLIIPTLENIGEWIFKKLRIRFKNLHRVRIERKTCGESFEITL